MARRVTKSLCASLLLVAFLAPGASAAIMGDLPTHWSFEVDEQGVWRAQGTHVSFAWTLKPFEVYDFRVDGVLLLDELSFPTDADAYTTDGATFSVMMGDELLARFEDGPSAWVDMNCDGLQDASGGPLACDLAFPEGSQVTAQARGSGPLSEISVELPAKPGAIQPCVGLLLRGTSSIEGTTVMVMGDARFRLEPSRAQPPPVNDRYSFTFDGQGNWQAQGLHISFGWTLAPFEVYDIMVDGVMLIEEISFPFDAEDYMTEGAVFKVMVGGETFFSIQDNGLANMKARCAVGPAEMCDVEFPEGSEVMSMAAGKPGSMSLFHVEYPEVAGTVVPCGTLGVRGAVSVDGAMVMFTGDLRLHYPVGQSMVG